MRCKRAEMWPGDTTEICLERSLRFRLEKMTWQGHAPSPQILPRLQTPLVPPAGFPFGLQPEAVKPLEADRWRVFADEERSLQDNKNAAGGNQEDMRNATCLAPPSKAQPSAGRDRRQRYGTRDRGAFPCLPLMRRPSSGMLGSRRPPLALLPRTPHKAVPSAAAA